MIPAKFAPIIFGFILSMCMSCIVSGVSTVSSVGLADGFLGLWFAAWMKSWLVAFPVVMVIAPITRKLVGKLTAQG